MEKEPEANILGKLVKNQVIADISKTILVSLFYGILISFFFSVFLKTGFDVFTIIAFAVAWYFIEGKLPIVVNSYRGAKA